MAAELRAPVGALALILLSACGGDQLAFSCAQVQSSGGQKVCEDYHGALTAPDVDSLASQCTQAGGIGSRTDACTTRGGGGCRQDFKTESASGYIVRWLLEEPAEAAKTICANAMLKYVSP